MSTFSSTPVVIDGKGHLLGRLASIVSKQVSWEGWGGGVGGGMRLGVLEWENAECEQCRSTNRLVGRQGGQGLEESLLVDG